MRHTQNSTAIIEELHAGGITGLFRPIQLERAGMTRDQLRTLVRSGIVEQVGRGLYRLASAELTENHSIAVACARVSDSIVCLLSALRVHEIGTQAPDEVWLGIPHKARTPLLRELKLRIVRFTSSSWTHGVQDITFEGVAARITTPARTIVDCFRFERILGPEIPMEALTDALRQRKVTVVELSRVLAVLPSRRLRAALDVRSI